MRQSCDDSQKPDPVRFPEPKLSSRRGKTNLSQDTRCLHSGWFQSQPPSAPSEPSVSIRFQKVTPVIAVGSLSWGTETLRADVLTVQNLAMESTSALPIEESDIVFANPDVPFDRTGSSGEVFVGYHVSKGKVAVKRLRLSSEQENEEDLVRVCP